jgi:hypothetical protein
LQLAIHANLLARSCRIAAVEPASCVRVPYEMDTATAAQAVGKWNGTE